MVLRIVPQKSQFVIGEHQFRFTIGNLPAKQRHDHDPPGNHRIDGNRTLQTVSGAEQQELDPAAGFENPEIVFYPPALEVEADHLGSLCGSTDLERRQQGPLDRDPLPQAVRSL